MDLYREYSTHYLPHLSNFIVAVVTNDGGEIKKGAGVLVNVGGRHFVATAGHCIKRNTRVMMSAVPLDRDQTAGVREVHIIREGKIETEEGVVPVRDIGYLEIDDPKRLEVRWDQLTDDRIVSEPVHIVGIPKVLDRTNMVQRERSWGVAVFGTTLIEETEDYLKFDFPAIGSQYNRAADEWEPTPFPEHPEGFSGGGCFGISETTGSGLTVIQYHLLGIQFDWHRTKRYVRVAPIRLWRDLLKRDGIFIES